MDAYPALDAADALLADAQLLSRGVSATVEHVVSIATASEQLSTSSAEIATCATEATRVSADAVQLAAEAMGHVDALRSNGTEAARIVGLVRGLSERTRILALNTMIEAARAGVSGRAMAAIATSIRSLAEDAATGTEAISATIDASSEHIAQVATAIEKVAAIAKEVQHYQGAIATAVEQQTQVTGDVARSAHQAERLGADVRRQLEQLGLGIDVGAEQPLR